MKHFISVAVLVALFAVTAVPVQATTPWVEDFETSFIPDGWTNLHLGTQFTWMWGWTQAHSGIHSAEIRYYWTEGLADEWLVTPAFDSTGEQYLLLDFWESGVFWAEGGEIHEVLVSATVADDPAAFTSVWQVTPGNYDAPWLDSSREQWVNVQIDLSQYAGQTVFVAFRYNSEASDDSWWIDDVRLRTPTQHEVRALAALPSDEAWLTGNEIIPRLVIDNIGPQAETFPVEMIIEHDGALVYDETVQVIGLASGAEMTVEFPSFICQTGNYVLQGTALLPEDGDPVDNTATATNFAYSGQRTPLGILYTNWACGPCVEANHTLDEWYPQQGNDASLIRVHLNWPSSTDPMYSANREQNHYLHEMCPDLVTGVPHLYLDNDLSVPSNSDIGWPTLIEDGYSQRRLVGSPLVMDVAFDHADSTALVTVEVLNPMPDGTYSLFVAVTEDQIYAPGSNGEEYHNQAFRWLFPDVDGLPLSTSLGTHRYSVDLDLDSHWAYENLQVTAWAQTDPTGAILNSASVKIVGVSAVEQDEDLPLLSSQLSVWPNPFNPRTTLNFMITEEGPVKLSVYDVGGRLITTLVNEHLSSGRCEILWQGKDSTGRNTPSGVYFARLETGGQMILGRMTLIR